MDAVHKPAHYSGDGIECIDVIEAALGPYGFRAFCLGNVLKYSWRHKLKGGAEDLAKADVYRAWALAGTAANRPKDDPAQATPDWMLHAAAVINNAISPDLPPAVEARIDREIEAEDVIDAINFDKPQAGEAMP